MNSGSKKSAFQDEAILRAAQLSVPRNQSGVGGVQRQHGGCRWWPEVRGGEVGVRGLLMSFQRWR